MQRSHYQHGSVVLDSRTKTWFFRYRLEGRQKSVRLGKFATKSAALHAAEPVRTRINNTREEEKPLVAALWKMYQQEKMPRKEATGLAYSCWMRNHILPRWGETPITALQPRVVELWLKGLTLAPKSRVHIRCLLSQLYDYAQWAGIVPPTERNPISLVRIEHATRRRKPRSLTVEEFQRILDHLKEPLRSMAILAVSLGLRASEVLGLQWKHVDWLNQRLAIEQRIYRQRVDSTKTAGSSAELHVDRSVLQILKDWRQISQFRGEEDWMFASPIQLGRLPISYPWFWRSFSNAAIKAGVGPLGTHTLRHTYRSWIDSVGTAAAVQQKLMRHSDIRTTMNVYGDVVDDRTKEAHSKVAALVFGDRSPRKQVSEESGIQRLAIKVGSAVYSD
jgi:integrase